MAKLSAGTRIKAAPEKVYDRIHSWAVTEKFEIVREAPPDELVLRASKPFKAEAVVTCTPDGDHTDLRLDVDAAVPRLMEPIVRPAAEKQFRDALEELKRELES